MVELLNSANAHDVSSNEAAAALHNIRNALNEYRNIIIQDANGQDLTRYYLGSLATFFSERPHQQERFGITSVSAARPPNVIGTLHAVARQNSDPTKKTSRVGTGFSRVGTGFSRTTTGLSEMTNAFPEQMDIQGPPKAVQSGFEAPGDRQALVVTDEREVRAQVSKMGSAAIAGWMMKKWLMQSKKAHEAREASTKPMDVDPKVETPAVA